jgi:hypothetical protein
MLTLLTLVTAASAACGVDAYIQEMVCVEGYGHCTAALRSDDPWALCSVDYRTVDGMASSPGDYTAVSGTAVWVADGENHFTFTIPIQDDSSPEVMENLSIELTPRYNAVVNQSAIDLEIWDDDVYLEVVWAEQCTDASGGVIACSLLEWLSAGNNEAGAAFLVRASLSAAMSEAIEVELCAREGTASCPDDFTCTRLNQTIAAGDTESLFAFPISEDSFIEGNEQFHIEIVNNPWVPILNGGHVWATIVDNDG